jgi:serine/threonine protein kinase/Tol biopolymer transport system component
MGDSLNRHEQVRQIFDGALTRAPEARAAYLAEACAGDSALVREVAALLAAHAVAGSFLSTPAGAAAFEVSLAPGARLGSYEVLSVIGVGGMGEVYKAHDSKLGRVVAIKTLPDPVARDTDRIARFEREARALAALNHPNIAVLYGLEYAGDRQFLVMEFVDGETLAERVTHGPLLVEDALQIALQIAEALETAHEAGIIHRDLKPANVKIARDERVKVLDFGLAKIMEPDPAAADLTRSPSVNAMVSRSHVILGTAAYMSPEQAKGVGADRRSDVFSFGVVFYEMLTGRRPFEGETAPEILASVLMREPDFAALPANVDSRISELVRRCLDKTPKRRWQAIGDVRAEIELVLTNPRRAVTSDASVASTRPLWKRIMPIAATALVASAFGIITGWYARPTRPLAVARSSFTLAEGQQFTTTGRQLIDISPDGTQMVYVANQRLYVRSMSELEARPIPGAELRGIGNPIFSPDGRSLAVSATNSGEPNAVATIKTLAVSGGAPVTICAADGVFGMSWGPDGIVFGQGRKGIMRVSASGGQPELLVRVNEGEVAHGPEMLPGGQAVLFTLASSTGADRWDKAQIVGQVLKSGERKTLIDGGSDGRYVPTGHLVYAREGVVFAVPFDVRRLEVTGRPVPIIEGVRRSVGDLTGTAHFSFSNSGSLVYIPGAASTRAPQRDIVLIDRKGGVERLKLPSGPYESPRFSPDGTRIAFGSVDGKGASIWIYDLSGTTSMRQLTFGGQNRFPIWSANGQRVVFQSDREGDFGIFWQRADGTGAAERLTRPEQEQSHVPESWSRTGGRLLFGVTKGRVMSLAGGERSSASLWTFSLQDGKAIPFGEVRLSSTLPVPNAVFSPDGRWVAYSSNEMGAGPPSVFVQPFPATGAKYLIGSGRDPIWSQDGQELFFWQGGGEFVVSSVSTHAGFTFGSPVPLPTGFLFGRPGPTNYDVAPDGRRFIGVVDAERDQSGSAAAPKIQIVINWFEELKARAPK